MTADHASRILGQLLANEADVGRRTLKYCLPVDLKVAPVNHSTASKLLCATLRVATWKMLLLPVVFSATCFEAVTIVDAGHEVIEVQWSKISVDELGLCRHTTLTTLRQLHRTDCTTERCGGFQTTIQRIDDIGALLEACVSVKKY